MTEPLLHAVIALEPALAAVLQEVPVLSGNLGTMEPVLVGDPLVTPTITGLPSLST